MVDDGITSFSTMFAEKGFASPERVAKRAKAERRQNLSDKQRNRGATRTAQINFRCSPKFKQAVADISERRGISIADLFEEWLESNNKAGG